MENVKMKKLYKELRKNIENQVNQLEKHEIAYNQAKHTYEIARQTLDKQGNLV